MLFRSQKKLSNEVSINETIDVDRDGNPLTYLDVISSEDTIAEDLDLKTHTEHAIALLRDVLDDRERRILTLRYGLTGNAPMTQREVSELLGISRSYVSRIEKKALSTLRAHFGDQIPDFDT
jgi:RNA polymerase sporulation-specific sigma factor